MLTAQQIFEQFERTNADCELTGESVVPLTKEYADYYRLQMDYIGIIGTLQDEVITLFK